MVKKQDDSTRGRPTGSRNTALVFEAPVFEEPPSTAKARAITPSRWTEIADALKARPDAWGRVSTHQTEDSAKQAASGIRNGQRSGFGPKGSFEARFGEAADGDFGVWARYVTSASGEEQGIADDAAEVELEEEPVNA